MDADIVLVRPARAANVAAACRAMKNMGLSRLVLVEPPEGFRDREPRALAYGAWDVLEAAETAPDLRAAVAAATMVVGTTGKRREGTWSPRELATATSGAGRLAVVFGPEATGLHQEEMDLCHRLVHIPTDPAQSSLNLAQAVLVVAYELHLGRLAEAPGRPAASEAVAVAELEAVLGDLRTALLEIGFLNPQNPEAVLTDFRRMLARAGLTSREATLLRGLARQVRWAAGRGR